jgi:hypothetical protein
MEHSLGDFSQQAQQAMNSFWTTVCGPPVGALSQTAEHTWDFVVTLICAAVVAVHAWDRYNTPKSNRVSTTRSAFLFTGAGYISASLILFLLLSKVALQPGVLTPGVLAALEIEGIQEILKNYCAPSVLAVVILTVLLPHTPILSSADDWLLKRFQAWGSIPQGVRDLAGKLAPQALHLGPDNVAELQEWIATEAEIPNEFKKFVSAEPAETSRGSLTRVLRLYIELQKLGTAPAYQFAFRSRQDTWLAIKDDFRVFLAQSQAFFVLFEQLTPLEGTAGEAALAKAKKYYRDICRKTHRDMTEFLAQLLLMVEGSDQRIVNRLQPIGFLPSAHVGPDMQVGPFLFIGAMMIFGMLGVVSVVSPHNTSLPPAVNAILIGMTRTIGILAAVLPKLRWGQFRPDGRGDLPYLAWLGWAAVAGIASFIIERGAFAIATGELRAAFDFVQNPLRPMAPMAFATSLVISILCDADLHLGQGMARRMSEGLISAVAAAVSIYICIHLLSLPSAASQVWSPMPYVVSSGLGFVSGFFGPYFYRRARDEEPVIEMAPSHAV